VRVVAGSNPVIPTKQTPTEIRRGFFIPEEIQANVEISKGMKKPGQRIALSGVCFSSPHSGSRRRRNPVVYSWQYAVSVIRGFYIANWVRK